MVIFGSQKKSEKKTKKKPSVTVKTVAEEVFDDAYKDELRKLGKKYFTKIIEEDREALRSEISRTFTEASNDLRVYIRQQFGSSIDYVRQELSRTLSDQLAEHRRVLNETQEASAQSLARNVQELHGHYGELSRSLEQALAEQQTKMKSLYQANQKYLDEIEKAGSKQLSKFETAVSTAETKASSFSKQLDGIASKYESDLSDTLSRQDKQLGELNQAQRDALESLQRSAEALEKQYKDLEKTLDGAVERQKQRMLETFSQNFARVVEQYILDALSDQFSVKDQLPSIMKRLEGDKSAIIEDAKL